MKGREERVVKGVERGICWVERLDRERRVREGIQEGLRWYHDTVMV